MDGNQARSALQSVQPGRFRPGPLSNSVGDHRLRKQLIKIPVFKAVLFLALASFVLAGCSGVVLNNWPGLASSDGAIYSAQMQLKKVDATNGSQSWVFPEKVDAKMFFSTGG
jgi:hypothetical protein